MSGSSFSILFKKPGVGQIATQSDASPLFSV